MRKRMAVSASKKRKNTNSCRKYKSWDYRKAELLAFQQEFGHTNVPQPTKNSTNKDLGGWVKTQRRQHKLFTAGKPSFLTQERINQLEALRFVWCLRQKGKKNKYQKSAAQKLKESAPQPKQKRRKYQKSAAQKLKESVRVNSICVSCQCLSLYFCYNLTFIC